MRMHTFGGEELLIGEMGGVELATCVRNGV